MTTAEIREMAGLPPLKAEEQSGGAADALATLSPLVATKVLDNMTAEEIRGLVGLKGTPTITRTESKFSSEELDLAFSKIGYTDDQIEVIEIFDIDYNPFDFADMSPIDGQVVDIIKANPEVTVEEISEQVGETPSEVQKRIDRLVKNGLLDLNGTKIEITEEGEQEVSELITVYKYAKRADISGNEIIAGTRDYCRDMLARDKSYTRQELLGMVNNFGQSTFTHRGGWWNRNGNRVPYCRHVWSARTVKVKKDA